VGRPLIFCGSKVSLGAARSGPISTYSCSKCNMKALLGASIYKLLDILCFNALEVETSVTLRISQVN